MDDLISRAEAIDEAFSIVWNGEVFKVVQVETLEGLPSAQPEIIRCKDCKYNQLPSTSGNAICEIFYGMTNPNGFCHMAERREVSK